MRIGIDINPLTETRTGVGNYLYEILLWLNENAKHHEFFLYSPASDYLELPKLGKNFHLTKLQSKHRNIANQTELPKLLKNDQIEVFWGSAFHLPARNRYTKNIRFVLTIHDLWAEFSPLAPKSLKLNLIAHLMRRDAKNADTIIAISEYTKREIRRHYGIPAKKIPVTYLAPSTFDQKTPTRAEETKILKKYHLVDDDGNLIDYLFFLSTIQPRKNLDTAIKAFNLYKSEHEGSNLKFIVAGNRGWGSDQTFELMENSPYKSDIIRPGYITTEKSVFYRNARAFVYPSLCEGFGLPVLEAFAYNCPVITAKNSSLPEVGGDAAFYINKATDEKSLAALIETVVNQSALSREKRILMGKKQLSKFSWEKCARETLEIIEGNKK
ncbi:glycosyltransferase family 4 protein [Candidatus Saccharibacteria bacterium]|nr:glycosyltransferase family 4 protein [Candidatus Saccharibacteria bacterium]